MNQIVSKHLRRTCSSRTEYRRAKRLWHKRDKLERSFIVGLGHRLWKDMVKAKRVMLQAGR